MPKGISLALSIIGANLHERNEMKWKSTLDKYERIPDKDIQKVLQVSYQGLDDIEQNIFLDLACFLQGSFPGLCYGYTKFLRSIPSYWYSKTY